MAQVSENVLQAAQEFLADRLDEDGASGYRRGQCKMLLDWLVGDADKNYTDITFYYTNMVCDALEAAQQSWPLEPDVASRLTMARQAARSNDDVVLATVLVFD